jgi:copper chaperone CopZ
MRAFFAVCLAGLTATALSAAAADNAKIEIKGPHICCKQCVNVVGGILGKVDGVADAKCDVPGKTVTFTAKDDAAAKAAVKALLDGGFFGKVTADGKEMKVDAPAPKKGDKADKVAVKDVHVCCPQCQNAIKKVFKDASVTFTDPNGAQRTVNVEGTGLDRGEVLDALRKAGFNGTVEK